MPLETRPRRYWTEQEDRVLQKEASLQSVYNPLSAEYYQASTNVETSCLC